MSTRDYSNKQEKKVAKALGGKQVVNSGASKFNKGDVKLEDWLIECKTCMTPKSSFSVKKEWLIKNKKEAIAMRKKYNALVIDFGDEDDYYIVDERTFKKLIEEN